MGHKIQHSVIQLLILIVYTMVVSSQLIETFPSESSKKHTEAKRPFGRIYSNSLKIGKRNFAHGGEEALYQNQGLSMHPHQLFGLQKRPFVIGGFNWKRPIFQRKPSHLFSGSKRNLNFEQKRPFTLGNLETGKGQTFSPPQIDKRPFTFQGSFGRGRFPLGNAGTLGKRYPLPNAWSYPGKRNDARYAKDAQYESTFREPEPAKRPFTIGRVWYKLPKLRIQGKRSSYNTLDNEIRQTRPLPASHKINMFIESYGRSKNTFAQNGVDGYFLYLQNVEKRPFGQIYGQKPKFW